MNMTLEILPIKQDLLSEYYQIYDRRLMNYTVDFLRSNKLKAMFNRCYQINDGITLQYTVPGVKRSDLRCGNY